MIKIKIIPVADKTPNFLVISHEVNNTKDTRNGKHRVAINPAKIGFGLNLKKSVSENGREAIWIMPETVIQIAVIETIMYNEALLLGVVVLLELVFFSSKVE